MHPSDPLPAADIVIFRPQFVEYGGEERVIVALARELHARGKPVSVMCYHDEIGLAGFASHPLQVRQLRPPASQLQRILALRGLLLRLARAGNPVPLLFNLQSALHAGLGNASRYHLLISDTYRLLNYQPQTDGEATEAVGARARQGADDLLRAHAIRRGVRRASRFLTNTRALSAELQTSYARAATVLYLGGFGQPCEQAPQRAASPLRMLTVSRLQSSKRIDWILKGMAQVGSSAKDLPPLHLHVVGKGPEQDVLAALSRSLGLAERVSFHGFVDDAELAALYSQCHVFLMPAVQGYGLPAIEALYRRQGVVLSGESGVAEILGGTPWAAIAGRGEAGFVAALREMLRRIAMPGFEQTPLPDLPTEARWAGELVSELGW